MKNKLIRLLSYFKMVMRRIYVLIICLNILLCQRHIFQVSGNKHSEKTVLFRNDLLRSDTIKLLTEVLKFHKRNQYLLVIFYQA